MPNHIELVSGIVRRWKSFGLSQPGASQGDIRATEQRLGVRLPAEMLSLYLLADGMEDNAFDGDLLRFLPMAEISPLNSGWRTSVGWLENNATAFQNFIVFIDYSLFADAFAIKLDKNQETIALVGGETPVVIANSFVEFLDIYENHPEHLFRGG